MSLASIPSLGFAACLVCLIVAEESAAQRQVRKGRHVTSKAAGYKITLPKDWVTRPIYMHDTQTVGWFRSQRSFRGDPKKGDTPKYRHAQLKLFWVEKAKAGEKWKRDYPYLLARGLKPGFKSSNEAAVTDEGTPVTKWEVKIATEGYDRQRWLCWVFSGKERDLAVEFRLLEEHQAEHREWALRCLQTFRFIEPSAPALPVYEPPPFALRDWEKLPLLERHRRRAALGKAHDEKVLATLPQGWTVQKSKHFLVVSHVDAKTTKFIHDLAVAFRAWLVDEFGLLSDEYPIRTTIRICAGQNEFDAYRSGMWRVEHNFANREVVAAKIGGWVKTRDVLMGVFWRHTLDHAPEFYFNRPVWLRQAIYGMAGCARLKRRKLVFPSSQEELGIFDHLRRTGAARIWRAQELIKHPDFGYNPNVTAMDENLILSARVLFRFILGPGKRTKALKGRSFLKDYVKEVRKLAREMDQEDEGILVWDGDVTIAGIYAKRRAAATSDDEKKKWPEKIPTRDALWKSYGRKVWARRVEFANRLFARTCTWSDAAWVQFEHRFEKFYGSRSR